MATTWKIDTSHSSAGFTVRHLVISKVHGRFGKWDGSVTFDEKNLATAKIDVTLDVASIDTNEEKRDAHLRSADFFDAENHPRITFKSKRVEKNGDGYKVVGDLTIRGTTREVAADATYDGRGKDPWGNERIAFSGKAQINRNDFGLKWNQALETGGVLVGEKVEIGLEVQAIAEQAARAAE
jgi:polyisoprenoid-binding protein YceI